ACCIEQEVASGPAKPQSRSLEPTLLGRVVGNPNRRNIEPASLLVDPGQIRLDAEHKAAAALQIAPGGAANQTAIHVVRRKGRRRHGHRRSGGGTDIQSFWLAVAPRPTTCNTDVTTRPRRGSIVA